MRPFPGSKRVWGHPRRWYMMKQPVLEVKAGVILTAFRQTRKIFSSAYADSMLPATLRLRAFTLKLLHPDTRPARHRI